MSLWFHRPFLNPSVLWLIRFKLCVRGGRFDSWGWTTCNILHEAVAVIWLTDLCIWVVFCNIGSNTASKTTVTNLLDSFYPRPGQYLSYHSWLIWKVRTCMFHFQPMIYILHFFKRATHAPNKTDLGITWKLFPTSHVYPHHLWTGDCKYLSHVPPSRLLL